jgi:hypothetical protein
MGWDGGMEQREPGGEGDGGVGIGIGFSRARLFRWPFAIPASFYRSRGGVEASPAAEPLPMRCPAPRSPLISRHKSLPSRGFRINLAGGRRLKQRAADGCGSHKVALFGSHEEAKWKRLLPDGLNDDYRNRTGNQSNG